MDKITTEEMAQIKQLTSLANDLSQKTRIASLERQVLVQSIFLKYGLTSTDSIDDEGNIVRGASNA